MCPGPPTSCVRKVTNSPLGRTLMRKYSPSPVVPGFFRARPSGWARLCCRGDISFHAACAFLTFRRAAARCFVLAMFRLLRDSVAARETPFLSRSIDRWWTMVQTAHRSEFFAGNREPSSPHVQPPEEIGLEGQEAEEFVV